MTLSVLLTAVLLLFPGSDARTTGPAQEPSDSTERQLIEVEKQKTLPHEPLEILGTGFYKPSKIEEPYAKGFPPIDLVTGSTPAEIVGRVGQQVAWFGIVREDTWVKAGGDRKEGHHELLVEHKYFDGLTDAHQQIVSFAGGGDFKAILPFPEKKLPFKTLTLVRCYGEVSSEDAGIPTVDVKFVRVWPWNNFAFMTLDNEKIPDRTNKRWRKGIDIPEQAYSATPDTSYYEKLLGKQKK
jgi:hypothetical protein